jgi:hypothetical protein
MMRNFVIAGLVLLCSSVWCVEQTKDFNIRPGFDDTVELEIEGVTCSFSYSCNGGTTKFDSEMNSVGNLSLGSSEMWQMYLNVAGQETQCFIGR